MQLAHLHLLLEKDDEQGVPGQWRPVPAALHSGLSKPSASCQEETSHDQVQMRLRTLGKVGKQNRIAPKRGGQVPRASPEGHQCAFAGV